MTKRIAALLCLVVVLSGIWYYLYRSSNPPPPIESTVQLKGGSIGTPIVDSPPVVLHPQAPETLEAAPSDTKAVENKPAPSFNDNLKNLNIVSIEKARQEVKANPHSTPPSLVTSALKIGTLFDSIGNAEEAAQFMDKMQECAGSDSQTTTSLQSICLGYARRVAKKYSGLQSQWESLHQEATPEAQKIDQLTHPEH